MIVHIFVMVDSRRWTQGTKEVVLKQTFAVMRMSGDRRVILHQTNLNLGLKMKNKNNAYYTNYHSCLRQW